jgi:hypothetical protein
MKINCKKLIGLFFSLSLSVSLFAQQYGQALKEDFENGIPNDWKQEIVSDQLSWTVESGDLNFPNGAFTGTKRVAFRNVSGVTKNASASLVSPVWICRRCIVRYWFLLMPKINGQKMWIN